MNDDNKDFLDAIKGIKPIKQDKHAHHHKTQNDDSKGYRKKQAELTSDSYNTPLPAAENLLDRILPNEWIEGHESIHYAKAGVQAKQFKSLKKGNIPIQASLDLHSLIADESINVCARFIDNAKAHNIKCILIIHGKGRLNKDGMPILKNILNQWLRNHDDVIAFSTALPRDGGSGAIYALLTGT